MTAHYRLYTLQLSYPVPPRPVTVSHLTYPVPAQLPGASSVTRWPTSHLPGASSVTGAAQAPGASSRLRLTRRQLSYPVPPRTGDISHLSYPVPAQLPGATPRLPGASSRLPGATSQLTRCRHGPVTSHISLTRCRILLKTCSEPSGQARPAYPVNYLVSAHF